MKNILSKPIPALLLATGIIICSSIIGLLLAANTIPKPQVYDVRVTIRNGNCSNTRTYTVEARSSSEARRLAASAALNSTRVIIGGTSVKR